jgi:DNA-binding transcriptional LysR family regulator
MVSTYADIGVNEAVKSGYLWVDWGTSFAIAHTRHFPDIPPVSVRIGLGRMALALLMEGGGSAYLAEPMVQELLAAGRLYRVADAPVLDRAFHAVYPPAVAQRHGLIREALSLLKQPRAAPGVALAAAG